MPQILGTSPRMTAPGAGSAYAIAPGPGVGMTGDQVLST